MFASSDWNDALGEYNAPTPGGRIGDGGALHRTNGIEEEQMQRNG